MAIIARFLHQLGYTIQHVPRISPLAPDATVPPFDVEIIRPGVAAIASCAHGEALAGRIADRDARVVVLTRDPRDVWCAWQHHDALTDAPAAGAPAGGSASSREVLSFAAHARGRPDVDTLAAELAQLRGWQERPGVLVRRYEDVCPSSLGGDEAVQLRTLIELAALVGWEGPAFRLAGALLASQSAIGCDGPWDQVGAWQRQLPEAVPHAVEATLLNLAVAWGYPISPPTPSLEAPGALAALISALIAEHSNTVHTLRSMAVEVRVELRRVEDAARLLQAKLAAEHRRFRVIRTCASLLAGGRAGAYRIARRLARAPGRQ